LESTRQLYRKPTDWLLASQFAPYVDAFTHHLTEGRYASHTVGKYLGCLAHFARWTTRCRLNIRQIDEDAVRRFLDGHLPRCECVKPVRVDFRDLRAASGIGSSRIVNLPAGGRACCNGRMNMLSVDSP